MCTKFASDLGVCELLVTSLDFCIIPVSKSFLKLLVILQSCTHFKQACKLQKNNRAYSTQTDCKVGANCNFQQDLSLKDTITWNYLKQGGTEISFTLKAKLIFVLI